MPLYYMNVHRAFEAAKHIYDLSVICKEPRIMSLFQNELLLSELLSIRLREEQNRLDGIPGIHPEDFVFWGTACSNISIKKAYATMQNQYVLSPADRIELKEAQDKLFFIKDKLEQCAAWK